MFDKLITVVISTYNSADKLKLVLLGYALQTDKNFDIIIADDGSSAEHRQTYEEAMAKLSFSNSVIWQEDRGFRKSRILNKAIRVSKGEMLIFTDGDCIPESDFVAAHRRLSEQDKYLSGAYTKLRRDIKLHISEESILSGECFKVRYLKAKGGALPFPVALKLAAKQIGLNRPLDYLIPVKPTFNGNSSSCWKADAIAVGGFDERMGYGGSDREFGIRLVNAGVRPKRIRYSARCIHLDHLRAYKDPEVQKNNLKIIRDSLENKRQKTEYGIN